MWSAARVETTTFLDGGEGEVDQRRPRGHDSGGGEGGEHSHVPGNAMKRVGQTESQNNIEQQHVKIFTASGSGSACGGAGAQEKALEKKLCVDAGVQPWFNLVPAAPPGTVRQDPDILVARLKIELKKLVQTKFKKLNNKNRVTIQWSRSANARPSPSLYNTLFSESVIFVKSGYWHFLHQHAQREPQHRDPELPNDSHALRKGFLDLLPKRGIELLITGNAAHAIPIAD
ncbi:hypothetical protein C8R47DRAFT_1192213 [Mycena vitilis]|nr:hypothetical protein C8R47DRAFT_1192213 [Mycena vitilis]